MTDYLPVEVRFVCNACSVAIEGETMYAQEAPVLYCPDCGEAMPYIIPSAEE